MISKLLPCPFCSGEAGDHDHGQEYWVQCQECGVRSDSTTDRETADTWWNLRTAPVVERQPVAWTNETTLAWMRKPNSGYAQVSAAAVSSEPVALYTAPPELAEMQALSVTHIMLDVVPGDGGGHEVYAKSVADVEAALTKLYDEIEELQSTIARLTAENERLKEAHEQVCANYNKVSYASEERGKEIERLKSGQGEPVDDYAAFESFMEIHGAVREPRELQYLLWRTGRTSQPAPVSVPDGWKLMPIKPTREMVLAGHEAYKNASFDESLVIYCTMLGCAPVYLDKVKELNR